jgi:hypothetical protein
MKVCYHAVSEICKQTFLNIMAEACYMPNLRLSNFGINWLIPSRVTYAFMRSPIFTDIYAKDPDYKCTNYCPDS